MIHRPLENIYIFLLVAGALFVFYEFRKHFKTKIIKTKTNLTKYRINKFEITNLISQAVVAKNKKNYFLLARKIFLFCIYITSRKIVEIIISKKGANITIPELD